MSMRRYTGVGVMPSSRLDSSRKRSCPAVLKQRLAQQQNRALKNRWFVWQLRAWNLEKAAALGEERQAQLKSQKHQ